MNRIAPTHFLIPLLLGATLISCASNPTGGTDFVMMSEKSEIEKGREMHEEILKDMPIYRDPELEAYVNEIGQRLVQNSHRSDIAYTFTIIDSPDINAFAAPGGYVYVNRGLLLYLTSEAQLAAVLGHEIGHVTGRHAVRQDAAGKTSNILSGVVGVVSTVTTGVNMGDITSLYGGALVSGYGRDMELEADELGAEYLVESGYEPQAMVEVISVLKNQEDFRKKTGQQGASYHGLFSTHPRNDVRLNQAVNNAGSLTDRQELDVDPDAFRDALEGLPIGQSVASMTNQDRNRYYQNLLNYTMVFAEGWTWEETPTTLVASAPDDKATLRVEVRQRTEPTDARTFARDTLGLTLQQTQEINQFSLQGITGVLSDTGERIAVIHYGPRAFIFRGTSTDKEQGDNILASIGSFRPIARNEQNVANPVAIRYVQVGAGTTYAQLARGSKLGQFAEDQLRLMNGDYPNGEPEAGEWIKIVE